MFQTTGDRMIDAQNLTKKFGEVTAVENLTLHVNKGEVFGFLGPNGAGKTTAVRMLACLISPTGGTATIGDMEIGDASNQQKIRKIVGLLPENAGLYDNLSAHQNLDYYGQLYKCTEIQRRERIEYFLRMLGLWEKRNLAVGTFSKGMKQKLAIARALIHDPQVLFLDEPTANLDPEASKTVRDFILELKKEKRTILLNTHLLDEAQRICDKVGILKTKLLALETPEKLRQSLLGRKTVVQLKQVNDVVVASVKKASRGNVEVIDNKLIIDVEEPEEENPIIIEAIQTAGGRIQFVTEASPSLEDAYLRFVRSENDGF
jgi:ABC-2 type transport system ATP-binding protein